MLGLGQNDTGTSNTSCNAMHWLITTQRTVFFMSTVRPVYCSLAGTRSFPPEETVRKHRTGKATVFSSDGVQGKSASWVSLWHHVVGIDETTPPILLSPVEARQAGHSTCRDRAVQFLANSCESRQGSRSSWDRPTPLTCRASLV